MPEAVEDVVYETLVLQGYGCRANGRTDGACCFPASNGNVILHLVDFDSDMISGEYLHLSPEHAEALAAELTRCARTKDAPTVIHYNRRPQKYG